MTNYALVNQMDGNERIEIEATEEKEALYEAINCLGWNLVVKDPTE